jgi:hypothetical protein
MFSYFCGIPVVQWRNYVKFKYLFSPKKTYLLKSSFNALFESVKSVIEFALFIGKGWS